MHGEGRLDGESMKGTYKIKKNKIVLIPETVTNEDWRATTFKFDYPDCIRDGWGILYCTNEEKLIKYLKAEFSGQENIREIIEGLKLVVDKRKELMALDGNTNYELIHRPLFDPPEGDINLFYDSYQIASKLSDTNSYKIHLQLYVLFHPVRIYNDKFELIKNMRANF